MHLSQMLSLIGSSIKEKPNDKMEAEPSLSPGRHGLCRNSGYIGWLLWFPVLDFVLSFRTHLEKADKVITLIK